MTRKDFGEGTNLAHYTIRASFSQERVTYIPAHQSIEVLPFFWLSIYCGSGQSPWSCDFCNLDNLFKIPDFCDIQIESELSLSMLKAVLLTLS